MNLVRIIMAVLLMASLPLQGLAVWAPAAACGDAHGTHAAATDAHAHQDHDLAAHAHDSHHGNAHAQHDDGAPAEQTGGHSCCHHVFTGATSGMSHGSLEAPRTVIQRVSLLHTLHIPELPQRPPRA